MYWDGDATVTPVSREKEKSFRYFIYANVKFNFELEHYAWCGWQ